MMATGTSPAIDTPLTAEMESKPEASSGEAIVDVGISTLGTAPHLLVEAVESVFAQTLQEWRLLISENGPGLETVRNALEPYLGDPRVRHVTTGTVVARGQNWTNLIRAGDAPYHGLLHDDDRWGPDFLTRRVEFLEKHRECAFVFSDHTVIDDDGRAIARSNLKLAKGVHRSSVIFPALYRRMFIGAPSVLVRRSAYEAVGAEYKELFFTDAEMWLRIAARFDVGYLPVWDADYRFHALSDSSSRLDLAKHSLAVLDAVEDLPVPRRLRREIRAEAYVWSAFDAIERGDRHESLERLTRTVRTDPLSLVRPRMAYRLLAGFIALALGARGRRAVTSLRDRRWRERRRRGISYTAEVIPVGSDTRRKSESK